MDLNLASHPEQRVAVFIDTQNLYHSAKANFRANVNYEELMTVAVNGRRLVRAFAYVIKSAENTEEKFFDALGDLGIEMRSKDLQISHTGAKKGDWDVGMAVDMIRLTEKVDTVVLCSGDGDFLEVVRYCQSRGVRVEIMAFEKTTNAKIQEEADHFTDLGSRDYEFLIGHRRKSYKNKEMPSLYSGSNLSAQNRLSDNAVQKVPPTIYGRNKMINRKIKPVVGLPVKPNPPLAGGRLLINDETKKKPPLDNVFGNERKGGTF